MAVPKWYTTAKKNEAFYQSDEFDEVLDQLISDYNKSTGEERESLAQLLEKWTTKRTTNKCMVLQHRI